MRYSLDAVHSPYLVTLVVGAFEIYEDAAGPTRVRTWYPKGRKADAVRCVKRTPQMVALFEKLTGQRYPWGDYSQAFVSEFIFGGMENTSATTLTDSVLHDARAALDYSAETLISHELAHQWFGDLLTCRDWPHGWLNEGFATYAEILWKEEADGADEADYQRQLDLEIYLSEVAERYSRPIVARKFDAPIDLFDRHLYEKGGLVLHELRKRLGDEAFFKAIRHYVQAHAGKAVETVDLARAVEEATGKNIDRFFDEYVLRAGHPQLKVEARYDAERGAVRLKVTQTQTGEPFDLTLPVELVVQGQHFTHALAIAEKEHTFFLPAAREPSQVILDARRDLLATLEVDKPAGWWREELERAKWGRTKSWAATALGKDGSAQSVAALARVLNSETTFHATRAACARALAAIRTPSARSALLGAMHVKHPKARRAVIASLGVFRGEADVSRALTALCKQGDESIFVTADAARALGKLREPASVPVLERLLDKPSFSDTIRAGALDGLVETRDPRAWPLIKAATAYGQPPVARRTAVLALARLAEAVDKKTEAVDVITLLLRDPSFRVRLGAIDAASALGDERLIGPLTSTPFLDGRENRLAREASRALRAKASGKELASLRSELDKLQGEVRALKEQQQAPKAPKGRRT
jgi:aminopeptidase N